MAISVKDLMASAGMTALAESFTGNKVNERPIRKFNAERYFAAKESIARVEAGFKGEVYELQAQIKKWAAAGEGVDEIKKKISNAGTDVWRKTKELIGKLIIMIEELFAGFTSKKGALDKIATTLEKRSSDIKTLARSILNNSVEVEESFSVELPSRIGGTDITNSRKAGVVTPSKYIDQIGKQLEIVGRNEDAVAFFAAIKDKDLYKLILADASAKRLASTANGLTGSKVTLGGQGTTNVSRLADNVGLYVGRLEKKKMQIKALKAGNISVDKYLVKDNTTLVDFLNALSFVQNLVYEMAIAAGKNIAKLGTQITDAKLTLNKIKNAPVKITKSSNKAQENVQLVRLYCTRAAKGLNLIRSSYNAQASYIIILGSKVAKAQEKALKYVTDDYDDDAVKIRTFGKNTYK